jgi:ATP-dependent protease ClpP protease subunit
VKPFTRSENMSKDRLFFDIYHLLEDYATGNLDHIVAEILGLLPASTFDAVQPFDAGRLFFTGPIIDDSVAPFIDDLHRVHLNLYEEYPIEITLNSAGGDLYAGESMMGAIQSIQSCGREVNISVQGLAASMASIVLQVGDIRRIGSNSVLMIHEVSTNSRGKLSSQAEDLEASKRLQDKVFGYYSLRTAQPVEYYHQKLTKKDLYMLAEDALAEGLVDEIIAPPVYAVTPPVVARKTPAKKVSRG